MSTLGRNIYVPNAPSNWVDLTTIQEGLLLHAVHVLVLFDQTNQILDLNCALACPDKVADQRNTEEKVRNRNTHTHTHTHTHVQGHQSLGQHTKRLAAGRLQPDKILGLFHDANAFLSWHVRRCNKASASLLHSSLLALVLPGSVLVE